MCYAYGTLDQATAICPMCKVFKPSNGRCPHVKDVCRNRALHPRHDVVFLKNAEVQTFNGCGYCKWARATANTPRNAGYQNQGWPGCCRPPTASEQRLIGAADWPAVSLVHRIPIPPDVRVLLDSLSTSKGNTSPSNVGSLRGVPGQNSTPTMSRRASYNAATTTRPEATPTKSSSLPIPGKLRSSGSPPQAVATLASNQAVDAGADVILIPSSSNPSGIDQHLYRHSTSGVNPDKRPEPSVEDRSSPARKSVELANTIARKGTGSSANSGRRPSISAVVSSSMSVNKVSVDPQQQQLQRKRVGTSANPSPPQSISPRTNDRSNTGTSSRRSLEAQMAAASISSSSSDGSGSNSETTVISDGGFTDYLSDESEAELQRQAEIKAAQIAHNVMEEMEFKRAREKLAHVDLRPPKSWTGGTGSARGQGHNNSQSPGYSQQSFSSLQYPSGSSAVSQSGG
ncbi:hypothetical protein ABKN59_000359 [Abortiporus biennis]